MTRLHFFLTTALSCFHAAVAFPADTSSSINVRGFCAAVPPPGFVEAAAELVNTEAAQAAKSGNLRTAAATTAIQIKIFMHVVASSTRPQDGYVTRQQLTDQFQVLKSTYAPSNINFILGTIDYRVNATEAVDAPGSELAMKKRLRKGDYRALNLYFMKSLRQNALGYCTFPNNVPKYSDNFYLDGCSIRYDSLPGGTAYNYNLGKTAVHETGHWFGLLHTFQGGSCTGTGDLISDTPAQLSPTNGCPTGRDSCPSQSGLDPIHNYMDYSIDICYTQFTPLQSARMLDMFTKYRLYA